MAKATPSDPRGWLAKDVDELRAVWDGLRLDSDDPLTERRFFGRLLSDQESGDLFERWVLEAFRLSGAVGHYSFLVPQSQSGSTREEIDGMVFDGWQGFLVECKFWTGKVDFAPLALLKALLDQRPDGTMGLFFSAFGYTRPALESVLLLRSHRILLFDQDDLIWALPPAGLSKQKATNYFRGRMLRMVRRKWQLAVRSTIPSGRLNQEFALFNEVED